jgi:hypothetical protein
MKRLVMALLTLSALLPVVFAAPSQGLIALPSFVVTPQSAQRGATFVGDVEWYSGVANQPNHGCSRIVSYSIADPAGNIVAQGDIPANSPVSLTTSYFSFRTTTVTTPGVYQVWGSCEGFQANGQFEVLALAPPPPDPFASLFLTPRGVTALIGQSKTFQSRVSLSDLPISNVTVHFEIDSGPCRGMFADIPTNALGISMFTTTCPSTGYSSVKASAAVLVGGVAKPISDSTTINWIFQPKYVAFGDSVTTGGSVASCSGPALRPRVYSPWGCNTMQPEAVPYPDRVAQQLGYTYSDDPLVYSNASGIPQRDLLRVGIWGYRAQDANQAHIDGYNQEGDWIPQLDAIPTAQSLVTGALGANDVKFSHVEDWLKLYLKDGDLVGPEVQRILTERKADFDAVFDALSLAKANGAKVVVTLYYNPYDTAGLLCSPVRDLAQKIVDALDFELWRRATEKGLLIADFRTAFQSHGSGSADPFVFGTACKVTTGIADYVPSWISKNLLNGPGDNNVGIDFDPHPNSNGTSAMASEIMRVVGQ